VEKDSASSTSTVQTKVVNTIKMVLKVYGSAMSTSRVLTTLLEKELPYEFIKVDIAKGEQYNEDYKKLQPFSKVPVLDDEGFIMYESRAICKYLDR
jgi:glutathione S-transferase